MPALLQTTVICLVPSTLKNSVVGDFNLVTETEIQSVVDGTNSNDDFKELQ